eukprot:gene32031-16559_t
MRPPGGSSRMRQLKGQQKVPSVELSVNKALLRGFGDGYEDEFLAFRANKIAPVTRILRPVLALMLFSTFWNRALTLFCNLLGLTYFVPLLALSYVQSHPKEVEKVFSLAYLMRAVHLLTTGCGVIHLPEHTIPIFARNTDVFITVFNIFAYQLTTRNTQIVRVAHAVARTKPRLFLGLGTDLKSDLFLFLVGCGIDYFHRRAPPLKQTPPQAEILPAPAAVQTARVPNVAMESEVCEAEILPAPAAVQTAGVPNVAMDRANSGVPNVAMESEVCETEILPAPAAVPNAGMPNVAMELEVCEAEVQPHPAAVPNAGVPNVAMEPEVYEAEVQPHPAAVPNAGVPNVAMEPEGVPNVAMEPEVCEAEVQPHPAAVPNAGAPNKAMELTVAEAQMFSPFTLVPEEGVRGVPQVDTSDVPVELDLGVAEFPAPPLPALVAECTAEDAEPPAWESAPATAPTAEVAMPEAESSIWPSAPAAKVAHAAEAPKAEVSEVEKARQVERNPCVRPAIPPATDSTAEVAMPEAESSIWPSAPAAKVANAAEAEVSEVEKACKMEHNPCVRLATAPATDLTAEVAMPVAESLIWHSAPIAKVATPVAESHIWHSAPTAQVVASVAESLIWPSTSTAEFTIPIGGPSFWLSAHTAEGAYASTAYTTEGVIPVSESSIWHSAPNAFVAMPEAESSFWLSAPAARVALRQAHPSGLASAPPTNVAFPEAPPAWGSALIPMDGAEICMAKLSQVFGDKHVALMWVEALKQSEDGYESDEASFMFDEFQFDDRASSLTISERSSLGVSSGFTTPSAQCKEQMSQAELVAKALMAIELSYTFNSLRQPSKCQDNPRGAYKPKDNENDGSTSTSATNGSKTPRRRSGSKSPTKDRSLMSQ